MQELFNKLSSVSNFFQEKRFIYDGDGMAETAPGSAGQEATPKQAKAAGAPKPQNDVYRAARFTADKAVKRRETRTRDLEQSPRHQYLKKEADGTLVVDFGGNKKAEKTTRFHEIITDGTPQDVIVGANNKSHPRLRGKKITVVPVGKIYYLADSFKRGRPIPFGTWSGDKVKKCTDQQCKVLEETMDDKTRVTILKSYQKKIKARRARLARLRKELEATKLTKTNTTTIAKYLASSHGKNTPLKVRTDLARKMALDPTTYDTKKEAGRRAIDKLLEDTREKAIIAQIDLPQGFYKPLLAKIAVDPDRYNPWTESGINTINVLVTQVKNGKKLDQLDKPIIITDLFSEKILAESGFSALELGQMMVRKGNSNVTGNRKGYTYIDYNNYTVWVKKGKIGEVTFDGGKTWHKLKKFSKSAIEAANKTPEASQKDKKEAATKKPDVQHIQAVEKTLHAYLKGRENDTSIIKGLSREIAFLYPNFNLGNPTHMADVEKFLPVYQEQKKALATYLSTQASKLPQEVQDRMLTGMLDNTAKYNPNTKVGKKAIAEAIKQVTAGQERVRIEKEIQLGLIEARNALGAKSVFRWNNVKYDNPYFHSQMSTIKDANAYLNKLSPSQKKLLSQTRIYVEPQGTQMTATNRMQYTDKNEAVIVVAIDESAPAMAMGIEAGLSLLEKRNSQDEEKKQARSERVKMEEGVKKGLVDLANDLGVKKVLPMPGKEHYPGDLDRNIRFIAIAKDQLTKQLNEKQKAILKKTELYIEPISVTKIANRVQNKNGKPAIIISLNETTPNIVQGIIEGIKIIESQQQTT